MNLTKLACLSCQILAMSFPHDEEPVVALSAALPLGCRAVVFLATAEGLQVNRFALRTTWSVDVDVSRRFAGEA